MIQQRLPEEVNPNPSFGTEHGCTAALHTQEGLCLHSPPTHGGVHFLDASRTRTQVGARRKEARKEAAQVALQDTLQKSLQPCYVEELRTCAVAAWRGEKDAEQLRPRSVRTWEDELARVQRRLQQARTTQDTAELRELGLEVVGTVSTHTLCAMAVQAAVQDGVDVKKLVAAAPNDSWLQRAMEGGRVETARALVMAGVEVNQAAHYGDTPLILAAATMRSCGRCWRRGRS